MMKWRERVRPARVAASASALAVLAIVLAAPAVPAGAQDNVTELRIRAMEAEIRALQRKVFPGDGKFFPAEIAPGQPAAAGAAGQAATTTPVADLLTRMEAVEAQLKRMTAQSEENANRLAQLEAKLGATTPAAASPAAVAATPAAVASPAAAAPAATATPAAAATPAPAPTPTPTPPATSSNMAAMTGGASAPKPAATPAARPVAAAAPSAQRLAAVRAIAKPQTEDPGDDEYSYGFRLWEAKFFPEAQQQLKLMIDRYPRHAKISHARNLLGRAYLDDGKPRDGATWFLQNYQANKSGERAADSLLYLAESMRQLKDTSRACIALSEFAATFAREAGGRLKAQYDTTRGGVKCN